MMKNVHIGWGPVGMTKIMLDQAQKLQLNKSNHTGILDSVFTLSITSEYEEVPVWQSSNEDVAKVDQDGNVTLVGEGSATITVTSGELVGKCSIKVVLSKEQQFIKDMQQGGNVKLTSNITLSTPVQIRNTVVLDLNGHDIIMSAEEQDAIWVLTGGNLTINGEGNIVGTYYSLYAGGDAKVEINGGNFVGVAAAIYAQSTAVVEINNGRYKAYNEDPKYGPHDFTLNLKDNSNAKILVKGGQFYKFNPANNKAEGSNTNFIATGYTVLVNDSENLNAWNSEMGDTWFEVVKKEEKLVSTESELVKEITSGNNIKLASSISIESPLEIKSEQIINLNNQSITSGVFEIDGSTDSYPIWATEGAKIVLEGNGQVISQDATYSMAVWANGGIVTIKGGTFKNGGDSCDLIYASAGGKVYIYGGEFKAAGPASGNAPGTANPYTALNVKDADYKSGASEIVVYGGRFYGFDPANNVSEGPNTNFVADGYESIEIEPNVWEVRKIEN